MEAPSAATAIDVAQSSPMSRQHDRIGNYSDASFTDEDTALVRLQLLAHRLQLRGTLGSVSGKLRNDEIAI